MRIILLKKIKKLGDIGDTILVKSGYARNYLIPKGQALLANNKNIQTLAYNKNNMYKTVKSEIFNAHLRILSIKKIKNIIISSKSGEQGKLFGSIKSKDIISQLKLLGVIVKKKEIMIEGSSIRKLGNYKFIFQPYKEVSCYIPLQVISNN